MLRSGSSWRACNWCDISFTLTSACCNFDAMIQESTLTPPLSVNVLPLPSPSRILDSSIFLLLTSSRSILWHLWMNLLGGAVVSLLPCISCSSVLKTVAITIVLHVPAARRSAQTQTPHSCQLTPLGLMQTLQHTLVFSPLIDSQKWMTAGATVISLKWAIPMLQEQEACKGFYVYTAAVPQPSLLLSFEASSSTTVINSSTTKNFHGVTRVERGSVEDFLSAMEVVGDAARDFLLGVVAGSFVLTHAAGAARGPRGWN
jgi:hypothetical protein